MSAGVRRGVSFDFTGQTVIVTGAARGIGEAIARLFLDSGAQVALWDLSIESLRASWGDDTSQLLATAVDVADEQSVSEAVAAVLAWTGRVDIAVNNAGVTRDSVIWKMTTEAWQQVLAVHLTGTFNVSRAVIPHMRAAGHGRIVNVTSYSGLHGNVGQANYAAAKAGIVGLTKTMAKELARFGISVNAISPNAMTPMVADVPADKLTELEGAIPMTRFASADEIAPSVAFLSTPEAGYITGTILAVDGGMSI